MTSVKLGLDEKRRVFLMSRVKKPGNKYMNTTHYDDSVYGPSKMKRIHCEGEDFHKAKTLSHWLFVKYDMSYKTYRNKSKKRRDELRIEFESDTGVNLADKANKQINYNDIIESLAEIGIYISMDDIVEG